ncbi:cell division protein SepF [Agromyces aerolatus]|uniref:cell division protein SepF n=1 Tax=Agromyces sp. LY-1074 TaxID=3074080 RepID=UPI00285D7EFF|nr:MULTISPECIES: cell division protein SepF [unclassified Agromyces]MDR5700763.1 cell division protein SepF [Agromyces sp. LY-1074]MDR5707284.1 cell division protein SepF [Agromyces sp. LY-1358]
MSNPLKKTMVYLGLADEELEAESPQAHTPAASQPAPAPVVQAAPPAPKGGAAVTPLRKAQPQPVPTISQADMNEILTVHPRQYRDAQVIAESFREGVPVIINLSQMSDNDARRLIDFASGLSQGLHGKIERVTSKVFLLSPAHVVVSGDTGNGEGDADATFFAHA